MRDEEFLPHIYLACLNEDLIGDCTEKFDRLFEESEAESRFSEGISCSESENEQHFCRTFEQCFRVLRHYDPMRLARIKEMKVPADRLRSFWAGIVLQSAVFHQTGFYAAVAYRKSGKPYIKTPEHLRVSLSHAGNLVVCALSVTDTGDTVDLSRGRDLRKGICSLGIDSEQDREILHPDKFLHYCMNEEELEAFLSCRKKFESIAGPSLRKESEENASLLHLWTVKESVLKCFGTGLGASPKLAKVFPEAMEKCPSHPFRFVDRLSGNPANRLGNPTDPSANPINLSEDSSNLSEYMLSLSDTLPEFRTLSEAQGAKEVCPKLFHWQVSFAELSFLRPGELADLEHYVIGKCREAAAFKGPEPLCEADGAPVRYACYTKRLETCAGEAWISLCLKLYEEK